ncbi:MAG TPA: hypothetical protein DEQ03_19345 [Marinilabiliales bacterium]|nr:hypothetical protein [Marinilabiliales bacterium]
MKYFVIPLIFFLIARIEASTTIPLKNQKLTVELPRGWTYQLDYWKIPLAFINSSDNLIIAVNELEQINQLLTDADKQNYFTHYKLGRLAWLSLAFGKLVKFYEYEDINKNPDWKGMVFGYVYKLGQTTFYEKSYYLTCKNVSYNLKYLIDHSQIKVMDTMDAMIRGLGCL